MSPQVARVRPQEQSMARQHVPNFVGISGDSVGSTGIYVLTGRVDTRYGEGLAESILCEEGDFLFIGPNVPHQPVNMSATEPAMAVVARNDPNEQEHVVLYG